MAKVLEMPKLSPTMTEGQLTVWHKKEGDHVEVDDLLAEVETDKATMEFRSFDKGTLLKLLVPADSLVKLGQPVAIIGDKGEDVSKLVPAGGAPPKSEAKSDANGKNGSTKDAASDVSDKKPEAASGDEKAAASQKTSEAAAKDDTSRDKREGAASASAKDESRTPPRVAGDEKTGSKSAAQGAANHAMTSADGRLRASPYVRKVARERDLDLTRVSGSGPHGRIVARDLDKAPAAGRTGSTGAITPHAEADDIRPLSMMRKTIARRLTESKQTVPHFYLTIDVDAAPIARLREQINDDLDAGAPQNGDKDAAPALKVSVNDLLIKACAIALVRVPQCNASFTPEALVFHRRVDISVAVAVPDGLLTPVVRNADKKSVVTIAQEVRDLAARAKAKKLRPEEMADGTFSISNLGMFGIDAFAAVINPPEGAILAVGKIRAEPVVWEGAVVAGQKLAMTLSCDHRVVDGAIGAKFLAELRSLIERPTQMLVL
jgi:pyruvate dehydrogenase E2 component (dihydrolipoamide acetyltransferase)